MRATVLLVDDDPPSLRAFQRVLARRDLEVLSACTVSEAFGLVTMLDPTPHPMVAFVDVLMPGMDGPRFVHALRSVPAFGRSPVVLVSGLSSGALEKTALDWGANGFILKSRGLLNLDQEFNGWIDRASLISSMPPPPSSRGRY